MQEAADGHFPNEQEGAFTATAGLNTEKSFRGALAPHVGQSGATSAARRWRWENVPPQVRQRYS